MAHRKKHTLQIQIQDRRGAFQRLLRAGDNLSIGLGPQNDIVVFDSDFPKSHTLIECKGKTCRLYIHPKMKGGVKYRNSTLAFQDLIVQDILPRKGDFYVLTFTSGRKGILQVGETKVGFRFDGAAASDAGAPSASGGELPTYTWRAAVRKALARDWVFKLLLIAFIGLEGWWGVHLSRIELPPEAPPEANKVQQRFARFMLQQEQPPIPETGSAAGGREAAGESDSQSENRDESAREQQNSNKNRPVTSVGLLGLIGGSGESNDASAAADFLLDQGLVKELDELIGSKTTLKSGRASASGSSGGNGDGNIDDLLDLGMSGGIDDLIAADAGVETVQLQKKGNVNIQAPQAMRGSEEAKGQRSAESVMATVKSQYGRVMYTYNKYLRQNPDLRGKVSLDVTIAANGRVSKVQVVESTINNADFVRDLINIVRQLRFSPISEGNVTVNLPFVFNRVR